MDITSALIQQVYWGFPFCGPTSLVSAMASAFSFGFSGDDIDVDESEMNDFGTEDTVHAQGAVDNLPKLLEAEKHDMKEWVSLLIYLSCLFSRSFPVCLAFKLAFCVLYEEKYGVL